MPGWADRIVIWQKYGFAPWQWDGYPAQCDDPSVTVLWAERARLYELVRTDANDWVDLLLSKNEKAARQERRKAQLVERYLGEPADHETSDDGTW